MANFDYDGELKPRRNMSSKKNDRLKSERGKTRMRKASTMVRQKTVNVREFYNTQLEEYLNEVEQDYYGIREVFEGMYND